MDSRTGGFTLFSTPLGACGIAWGARGVIGVQLPEGSDARTRARVQRRFPDAIEAPPPRAVESAIAAIGALLRGESADLASIALDLAAVPAFHRRVYELTRAIPPRATLTYGDIATRLGKPGSVRAVGQALGQL